MADLWKGNERERVLEGYAEFYDAAERARVLADNLHAAQTELAGVKTALERERQERVVLVGETMKLLHWARRAYADLAKFLPTRDHAAYRQYLREFHEVITDTSVAIRECEPPKPTREELLEEVAAAAKAMTIPVYVDNDVEIAKWGRFNKAVRALAELDAAKKEAKKQE